MALSQTSEPIQREKRACFGISDARIMFANLSKLEAKRVPEVTSVSLHSSFNDHVCRKRENVRGMLRNYPNISPVAPAEPGEATTRALHAILAQTPARLCTQNSSPQHGDYRLGTEYSSCLHGEDKICCRDERMVTWLFSPWFCARFSKS